MSTGTETHTVFLEQFEAALEHALLDPKTAGMESDILMEAARYLCGGSGAKRMRPQLVDHFGSLMDIPQDARVKIAVAGELIHAASLMHDDVVDEGTMRRGRPTVNVQWKNSVAVLSGDLMLCLALQELSPLGHRVSMRAVDVVASMTWAAMAEVESRGDVGLDTKRWRAIAEGKTGALLAWCAMAPAMIAGQDDVAERFALCGHHLGVAFQLADDLWDMLGVGTGKDRFADLRNRNPAYPIAVALEKSEPFREGLAKFWGQTEEMSDETLEEMGKWLLGLGVHLDTMAACEREIHLALEALGSYSEVAGGVHIARWARELEAMARICLG